MVTKSGTAPEPMSLSIKTPAGKHIELTSAKFERWFAGLEQAHRPGEKTPHKSEHQRLTFQHFMGLKNPSEVLRFLRSPEGEKVIGHYMLEMETIAAIEERQRFENLENSRNHMTLLAIMFLLMTRRKHAHANKLNEQWQQHIDKILHKMKEDSASSHAPAQAHPHAFNYTLNALDAVLDYQTQEKARLAEEREALMEQAEIIAERQAIFEATMAHLHEFMAGLPAETHQHHALINEHLELVNARMLQLNMQLAEQMDILGEQQGRQLAHEHSAHVLHAEALLDMLSFLSGHKIIYTEDGIEARSMQDAAFILTPDQKIIKDGNGNRLLIGVYDDLQLMDDMQKNKAMRRFDKMQPEIMTIPRLVNHYNRQENKLMQQRRQQLDLHDMYLDDSIKLTLGMKNQVQALKASATAELQKPQPSVEKIIGLTNATPKFTNSSQAFVYNALKPAATIPAIRQSLETMARTPTPLQITALSTNMADLFRKNGVKMPKSVERDMSRIVPGQPVPPRILMNLNGYLNTLEQKSLRLKTEPTMAPPVGAPVLDTAPRKASAAPKPAEPASTAPTPFSWPPKPGGY